MSTKQYYKKKKKIQENASLDEHQKHILIMDLRTQYYGMDRSGLNHMDSVNFKPALIKVM